MIASNTELLGALVFGQVTPPFLDDATKRMPAVLSAGIFFLERMKT